MSLVKLNNRAVKDVDSVGSIGTGDLTFISKQTASSDASISFTSGIDSTYKEYIFFFNNIHPATDNVSFTFNGSTDGGSNYNATKTTTIFTAFHDEANTNTGVAYAGSFDLAQSTAFQPLTYQVGNDNDHSSNGYLCIYNPSSTTFVKHFISRVSATTYHNYERDAYTAGYFNTTSAIDAVQFKMSSGNIDSGEILLYGVN